ncbi:MAG: alpha-galactosidase, partial [Paracoccaceae bacterium]
MIKTWRLDDLRQTLVLGSREERLAQILYWGPPLPASENLQTLVQAGALDLTGGMLDENPALSICPEARRGFPGQAGLVAEDAQGKALLPLFIFESAEETVNALVLTYRDDALQLTYQAQFDLDPETHVISVKASLSSVDPVK